MGLKIGIAALAASQGLYVRFGENWGGPLPLAQVLFLEEGEAPFALRYPNGFVAELISDGNRELQVSYVSWEPWVPTKEQVSAFSGKLPLRRVLFGGGHVIRDVYEFQEE